MIVDGSEAPCNRILQLLRCLQLFAAGTTSTYVRVLLYSSDSIPSIVDHFNETQLWCSLDLRKHRRGGVLTARWLLVVRVLVRGADRDVSGWHRLTCTNPDQSAGRRHGDAADNEPTGQLKFARQEIEA
jgi:hypothetical protein